MTAAERAESERGARAAATWRKRFIEHGPAGPADKPRPGRPPSIPPDRGREAATLTWNRPRPAVQPVCDNPATHKTTPDAYNRFQAQNS